MESPDFAPEPAEDDRPAASDIRRINPIGYPGWNSLIAAGSNSSFFHTEEWAQVLADTYGYQPVYVVSGGQKRIDACLPLMEVDSWLTGRRGVGLPFTDYCEPVDRGAGEIQKLFRNAVEFGKNRGWKYLEFRGGRELLGRVPPSLSFYGHHLDLTADEDALLSRMESSTLRAVRKAEKNGLTVDVLQNLEAVRCFYGLQCRTRKRHGLPPQPFQFFLNIHRHILSKNLGMVAVARYQGRAVSAAVYFHSNSHAIFKYGASDDACQHLRGTNLVFWRAIQWFARRGMKRMHLGRTSLNNEGLRRFKLGWGAAEHGIEYVRFDLRKDEFVVGGDETSGWHTSVFRRMPVGLARAVGGVLYRHWA